MEGTAFFDDEAEEKARNRHLLAFFLKLLWTSLALGVILGLLIPLTILFRWSSLVLPCMLGFLAGVSLTIAVVTSLENRTRIPRLLGAVTLPGLAAYLSLMAVSSPQAYESASSVLMPFVAYALAALLGGVSLVRIWRRLPVEQTVVGKEPLPVSTRAKKEQTSHEGVDLHKAA